MYTKMEFNALIKAVDEALPQEVSCPGLEKTILKTQLVEILLTNNYFTFYNKLYHQSIEAFLSAIPSPEICEIRLNTQEQNQNSRGDG